MKKFVLIALCLVLAVLLFPFVAPSLGFATFRDNVHERSQMVTVGDGELNVILTGSADGPPAILVHGQPGSADMMRPLAEVLADRGYRVVTYDRMGWGYSGQRPIDVPANPTGHARDLVDLSRALELEQPLLVGYSYGGGVTMEANRLAPNEFPRLVLVSSVGDPAKRGQPGWLGRILYSPLVMQWVFGMDILANQAAGGIFAALEYPETLSAYERQRFMASLALQGVATGWDRERRERYLRFDRYQPEVVRACALIVHGNQDQIVKPSTALYVADRIDGSRLVEIEDAGHAMVVTKAAELGRLIESFDHDCG